jgi:hypothetical protein
MAWRDSTDSAGVMAYGDVPALFIIAAVLAFLSPQAFRLPFAKRAA